MGEINLNLPEQLRQTEMHLEEQPQVKLKEKIVCMLQLVAKRKRIHQMLASSKEFTRCCHWVINVITFNVYSLLDEGASLYFMTMYIPIRFDILFEQLLESFCVSMPICEFILVDIFYYDCTISFNHNKTMVQLVNLHTVDFSSMLVMDWLHDFYASVNRRTRVVKFKFPNAPIIEQKSSLAMLKVHFILYLKTRKLVYKGCMYHLVRVNESSIETPPIQSVSVVSDFLSFPI